MPTEPAVIHPVRARVKTARRTVVIAKPGEVAAVPIIVEPERVADLILSFVPPSRIRGMHLLIENVTPLARLLRRVRGPVSVELWAPREPDDFGTWWWYYWPHTEWRQHPMFLNRLEGTAKPVEAGEWFGKLQACKTIPRTRLRRGLL